MHTTSGESGVIAPAAAAYLVVRWRSGWWRHIRAIVLAGVVLAVVGLSWVTFVQATPASHRPLVLNDRSNSAFGLVVRYNGVDRLLLEGPEDPLRDLDAHGDLGLRRRGRDVRRQDDVRGRQENCDVVESSGG